MFPVFSVLFYAVILAIPLGIVALKRNSWRLLLISFVCFLPFDLYLSAAPAFPWFLIAAFCYLAAVVVLWKKRQVAARWLMCVPTVSSLAVLVMILFN